MLFSFPTPMLEVNDFNAIRIGLASPELIRSWSYGEVTKPETINYRTLKPEKDGLFCERIFGPTKDWECYCGKYKRVRYKGIVCDKCGVEVARSKVRRERMGHIELASPVSHIWYFKGTPSRIGLLLDLSPRNLERILYFALYVITTINEEERHRVLGQLGEDEQRKIMELEQNVANRIKELEERREGGADQIATELENYYKVLDEEMGERLATLASEAAQLAERLALEESLEATEAIIFPASEGKVVVKSGETIVASHQELLKKLQREKSKEIESGFEEKKERARIEAEQNKGKVKPLVEAEIAQLQERLAQQTVEIKAITEHRRRDIEGLKKMDLLQEGKYRELKDNFGALFRASMGAEAVRELIAAIDLDKLSADLRHEISATVGQRRKKATKRLRVVEAFRKSNTSPEWMILSVLPVLPPDLRPMVQLDGGRFATSDLNDLYRRVINRNNRLKRLLELGAPEIIIRNEKRMLQEATDALIDNGRRGRAVAGSGNHKLKSLSDMLKGKQGRFRQNLLGKRVDYSGRSVIVVGPDLKLHQCGLPKRMALELFKPFVMRKLVEQNFAHNIKSAKRFVERVKPEVWDVLEEVIRDHPVLLNRAPTLHRLGIQAFEAVLVEGNAIQIHPLVCSAFNADFDGDQMAVHVPLSEKAQEEARTLMLSTRNILSPATGDPAIGATQDMVLGCYYLTRDRPGLTGEGRVFSDTNEALIAFNAKIIDLQAKIKVRLDNHPGLVETTAGRIIFNEALPEKLRFKNLAMDKQLLRETIAECFRVYGRVKTAELADEIKRLGFSYATKAGITFAIDDVKVPREKAAVMAEGDLKVREIEAHHRDGLITDQERFEQVVALWTQVTDDVQRMVKDTLDPYGSIYTIATSGATKAKFQQIRQLSGMRGLMSDPSGRTIEIPIKGNFREGLSVLEYFISSHGARKGLADTALRTAESGYLTRRLIDVAQDVIVQEENCGTEEGVWVTEPDSKEMDLSYRSRLIGRISLSSIPGIIEKGEEILEEYADMLIAAGVKEVRVRSVLACLVKHGVCRHCYGRNLASGRLVNLGEAVGIIAAQSIGEPGTQLTMRTFHTGGVAMKEDITQGLPRVEELFEARVPKGKAIISEIDGVVEILRDETQRKIKVISSEVFFDEYQVPEGFLLAVTERQAINPGDILAKNTSADGQSDLVARNAGDVIIDNGQLRVRFEEKEEREYVVPMSMTIRNDILNGKKVVSGDSLTEGDIDPQDVLRIQGRDAVQSYLVKQVQKVYRGQGVTINDKHIEVIVRQMLRRVKIDSPGDTDLLPNELVDRFVYEDTNAKTLAEGGEPATAQTVLLGVTKASLNTDSFLAAASFQETTRVLTEAAIEGKTDHLVGLKENVIIGKLIPAGSGIASKRELLQKKQEKLSGLALDILPPA